MSELRIREQDGAITFEVRVAPRYFDLIRNEGGRIVEDPAAQDHAAEELPVDASEEAQGEPAQPDEGPTD